ncbi:SDR family oxidoreductase [Nocardia sp. NBC_00565]|uniref:SDR family NAD(P)-dependent oxidoreductase n=1 Tax=Nocardia sp. NBC_00565 TaxID=2975993 RepID=UPI002E80F3AB|nr:SDR family NAD(P)-dependent oxidoreductase [Nocardia sp. NBC_00565]WUC05737.1 SDR family oxidoreductase [Nocardia sp. NBC_00565]
MLKGKVALVTGAGHGIGRAHALELAGHGATVVVNDLGSSVSGEGNGRDADRVVDIIRERGATAIADYGDVGDEAQAEAMVARAFDEFGRLDIVVNNAGIVRDRAIWNMSVEDFDLVVRVHLRGSWLVSRAAATRWRADAKASGAPVYGRIINTTSGAGLQGNFGQSNYSPAKAAIAALTQTLSLELASIGVTVNAISPVAATRLASGVVGQGAVVESDERADGAFDPLDPALAAPVVAWLAAPQSGHISGQVLRVTGEYLALMQGWEPLVKTFNGRKYWDATTLGAVTATEFFRTRAPGVRAGS